MLIVPREESQEGKLRQKFHLLYEIIWFAHKGLSGFYLSNQQCFNPENVKLVCCWSIQPLQVVDTTLRACLIKHREWELQEESHHTSRRTKQWKFRHRTFLSLHHQIPSTSFLLKGKMQGGLGSKMRRCLWIGIGTHNTVLEDSGRYST